MWPKSEAYLGKAKISPRLLMRGTRPNWPGMRDQCSGKGWSRIVQLINCSTLVTSKINDSLPDSYVVV